MGTLCDVKLTNKLFVTMPLAVLVWAESDLAWPVLFPTRVAEGVSTLAFYRAGGPVQGRDEQGASRRSSDHCRVAGRTGRVSTGYPRIEGNMAEAKTLIPVITGFQDRHDRCRRCRDAVGGQPQHWRI